MLFKKHLQKSIKMLRLEGEITKFNLRRSHLLGFERHYPYCWGQEPVL